MFPPALARRGARLADRLAGSLGRAHRSGPDEAEVELLRKRLRRARTRVRARDAEIARLTEELRRRTEEIAAMRASLRDPDPEVVLPPAVVETVDRVHREHLSYLSRDNLAMLARLVVALERDGRPGLVVEAGTARGGSAIVMAAAKAPERPMKVYDVFGMIPAPSEKDGEDVHRRYRLIRDGGSRGVGGELYYGYRDDLYSEVRESFARCGVEVGRHRVDLVRGLFQDTIDLAEPVALAHLDGDWYESTLTCLERLAPLLVPGGRLVLDDYDAWSGCKRAVDEYFAGRPGFRLERRAKLHAVRLP
ncbi:asparagine synthase (glutamine-hydrolysing) [Friedmanniella luteola]|uniref:Asparagine synthase (Glutamine-hydrolysing) n=1 Tax=Friedmanniella luteola TaxID=546871 RepID=A0A1H1RWA3_9ACTN|nr:TylF/MycF/NovP-related O-methyltransferase [Friedmanniella luteola]SDS39908.1 asparagine synthase (glutamine-hydrolysing) [Friedmanniella luteola]